MPRSRVRQTPLPLVPIGPIMFFALDPQPASVNRSPIGQGGQSFFKDSDQLYMAYHAYQPPSGQPVLNIRPIYFDAAD